MFENKMVAVMNEKVEVGVLMNALAHASIGMGANLGKASLRLTDYVDADGGVHPNISEMPFIILKANSNKIRALRHAALQAGIRCTGFTHTMTTGGFEEQLKQTEQTQEADLIYYGIVLFGAWGPLSEMTKKFSLWK